MKTEHKKDDSLTSQGMKTLHMITITGRADEFPMVIDALANAQDERVQKMAAYIRKAVGLP